MNTNTATTPARPRLIPPEASFQISTTSSEEQTAVLDRLEALGVPPDSFYLGCKDKRPDMDLWNCYRVVSVGTTYARCEEKADYVVAFTAPEFFAKYPLPLPMKQITNSISINTKHDKSLYDKTIALLISMGFSHSAHSPVERLFDVWGRDEPFVWTNPEDMSFSHSASGLSDEPISAEDFLAQYGPATLTEPVNQCGVAAEPVVAPAPENPANFTVDTGRNKTLSRIVQELAFAAGLGWACGGKEVYYGECRYINANRVEGKSGRANCIYRPQNPGPDEGPIYDAATQMGEIVRLLSTPVVPPIPPAPTAPELYGYSAIYKARGDTVNFGCAEISVNLLECVRAVMDKTQPGTRSIKSVTLSSGKTLDRDQIGNILCYVAAVEEYAKKYPQKS